MRIGTLLFVAVFLACLVQGANAQEVGDCEVGVATSDLDINGVRARIFNGGQLFYNGQTASYEVPRGSGIHSLFAAGIWMGGKVNGELRTAAATYAQGSENYEYFPGPLDAEGNPPEDCTEYDRIWNVSVIDIYRYDEEGIAAPDLAEWPVHLGAPFFDVDGDGAYNLGSGDRPRIWGDQMAWWVMNDVAGPHMTTLSEPIGLDVRVSAFSSVSPAEELYYTTFYRYEITYRGNAPIDSMYFSIWNDPDLGNYQDDYIGSDTTRNLGFVYNGDNDDEVSAGGYGLAPPAQGVRYLETPDSSGMTVFGHYFGAGPRAGDPDTDEDYYNYMRGLWRDGTPYTVGGDGQDLDGDPTTFIYPNNGTWDDPVPGYWSELCPDVECEIPISPGDRRFHMSTGPFRMEPGEVETISFAYVWARGSDNFDSPQRMKAASDFVENAYVLGLLDPVPPAEAEEPPGPSVYGLQVYPSPFADEATVRLVVPEGSRSIRVSVFDVLGREIAVLANGIVESGEHQFTLNGADWPSGQYVVRLQVDRQTFSRTITHIQ